MSDVCEQLYACVRRASEGKGETDISTHKIAKIEESLENILLWIGGLGFGSMLGKMALKSKRFLKKMMKVCSRVSEFLNSLKDREKQERKEEQEEKETVDKKMTEIDEEDEDDNLLA